jgi:[NiFe] hydrogenase diaphorase moiety small subunit
MTDIADIHFTIDGRACTARPGQTIVEAARDNHIYIPVLCRREGLKPAGSCRVCTVRVNGRYAAACTLPVGEGMVIENDAPDLQDIRRAMVEMLYVEGNHFCPSCEKSGNCELQALAYRFRIVVPRFPYQFPHRRPDGSDSKILLEHNRCIQCRRCIRSIKAPDGRAVFGMLGRPRPAGQAERGRSPPGHGPLPGRDDHPQGHRLRRAHRPAAVRRRSHRRRR